MSTRTYTHNDYTIGWICPLEVEQIAAVAMLDEEHDRLAQPNTDNNAYILGSINKHNVVIAGLPVTGNCPAATVVAHMRSTFPRIRFGLLVGIGGGVPTRTDSGHVRLGHVVVSKPNGQHSGAIQYDHGKAEAGVFRQSGFIPAPPNVLLGAAQRLAVLRNRSKTDPLQTHLQRIDTSNRNLRRYKFPGIDKDHLYESDYIHANRDQSCWKCGCDESKRVDRTLDSDEEDDEDKPYLTTHRGTIASGELVMRDGELRDSLAKDYNVICFEMEAAGALNDFPCLIIRGISDYSDSHKSDRWHGYASATAAAYARELFFHMPVEEVENCKIAETGETDSKLWDVTDRNLDVQEMIQNTRHLVDYSVLAKLSEAEYAAFDSFSMLSNDEEEDFKCLEGTRQGILEQIDQWIDAVDGKTLFWLSGAPGTGKSTIARTVALKNAAANQLGASFFFKRNQGDCGNASRLFTTIAAQLTRSMPGIIPFVKDILKSDPAIVGKSLEEQFQALILDPISKCHATSTPLLLVIDALDECDGYQNLRRIVRLFLNAQQINNITIRVLITSRPELPIELEFKDSSCDTYDNLILQDIPIEVTKQDLSLYLQHKLHLIRKDHQELSAEWPGDKSLYELVDMAYPLFIFAATICRYLSEWSSDPEEQLTYLCTNKSTSLDHINKMYVPILDRLLQSQAAQRSTMLSEFKGLVGPIIVAEEPLSIRAWSVLLRRKTSDLIRWLKGLRSLLNVKDDLDSPIRLHHLSFANFLLDKNRQHDHDFWIDTQDVHGALATVCLDLLWNTPCLKQDICDLKKPGYLRKDVPASVIDAKLPAEVQYACRYWTLHLRESTASGSDLDSRVHAFLRRRYLYWFEALGLLGRASEMIQMTSDLSTIFSGSKDVELKAIIYDTRRFTTTNNYIVRVAPLQLYSSCIAFAPESSVVGTSRSMPAWLVRIPKRPQNWGNVLHTLEGHSGEVFSVTFSPDGKQLASGTRNGIHLWNVVSGSLQYTLIEPRSIVRSVAFSPDGKILASDTEDGAIKLWDTTGSLRHIMKGHTGRILSFAFSIDGKHLASGSDDNTIKIWSTAGYLQHTIEGHSASVVSVVFLLNSRNIVSKSDDNTIKIWDITGHLHNTFQGYSDGLSSIVLSPDGDEVISCAWAGVVKIWDVATGSLRRSFKVNTAAVYSIALSPNGKQLVVGCHDPTIQVWDFAGGFAQQKLKGHLMEVSSVAFSPDGRLLASGSADGTVRIWDPAIEPLQQEAGDSLTQNGSSILLSNEEQLAIGFKDSTIQIWDIATLSLRRTLEGLLWRRTGFAFSPNGMILASASWNDKTVKLWNLCTGDLQSTLKGRSDESLVMSFSPSGEQLASGSWDNTIAIWNVSTGELQQTLAEQSSMITSLSFSADGKQLASGLWDGTVVVWDLSSGDLRRSTGGKFSAISSLAFSADGEQLAAGSRNMKLMIWNIITGLLLHTIEVDAVVAQMSFHSTLPVLKTDLGEFEFGSNSDRFGKVERSRDTYVVKDWIIKGGERILWLPQGLRPNGYKDYAGSSQSLVINSVAHGVVCFVFSFKGTVFDVSLRSELNRKRKR